MKRLPTFRCSDFSTKPALVTLMACGLMMSAFAQVNSGSDGRDGALDLTGFGGPPRVIYMIDHPDGIYRYTYVNISVGVTLTFVPNAKNTPVVWLVQSNCIIGGTVDVSGRSATNAVGAGGGPGGWG